MKITWRGRPALSENGLTLLEMVITLVLLSAMGVIVTEAFRIGRNSWERQEVRVEAEQRLRVVYETIAQEMASIQAATEIVDRKRVVAFEGWPDRIRFYGKPDRYQSFPYNAMIRNLLFYVDPERGLVMDEIYPLVSDSSRQRKLSVVEPKVTRIGFRYLDRPGERVQDFKWIDRWRPVEFLAQPPQRPVVGQNEQGPSSGGFPLAVELKVIISGDQRDEGATFLFPVHLGRNS